MFCCGCSYFDRALARLIDIISKQLPNMPAAYVKDLVLDRSKHHERFAALLHTHRPLTHSPPRPPERVRRYHESLVLKLNGKLVGGITYKPFRWHRFIEIVFCVVHGK